MILIKHKFHVAHFGNADCIFKSLREIGKQLLQFIFAFDIKFFRFKPHPVGIVYCFARLHRQKHVLYFGVLPAQIVRIVGYNQRKPRFSCKAQSPLIHRKLFFNTVILQFQIKMILAKNLRKGQSVAFRPFKVLMQKPLRDSAGETGGQRDQPLGMLPQKREINPGLAVKAVQKRRRYQRAQIL